MNNTIIDLLRDLDALHDLRAGLPYAFELAETEAQGINLDRQGRAQFRTGQEVGIHRERVILGYLLSKLGEIAVRLPSPGDPRSDVLVSGIPLQIKTVTGNGEVTAKWTADTASAQEVIENFRFEADLWLVRIWWDRNKESVFYVPREVLQETAVDCTEILRSATGTNNRGVKLRRDFMSMVESDERTTSVTICWQRSGRSIEPPIVRYTRYWLQRDYLDGNDR